MSAKEVLTCPKCAAYLGIGDAEEVVLFADHLKYGDKLLRIISMLSRAVVAAETDLQYNRPADAHSKLSAAWQNFLDMGASKLQPHLVSAALPKSDGAA